MEVGAPGLVGPHSSHPTRRVGGLGESRPVPELPEKGESGCPNQNHGDQRGAERIISVGLTQDIPQAKRVDFAT